MPVTRLVFKVFPCEFCQYNRKDRIGPAFYTFISPSECDSFLSWLCGSNVSAGHQCLLSWNSRCLPADILHSRQPHQTREPSFGNQPPRPVTRSVPVVSHHLDGFLREQDVSLLRLTTGQRFDTFPSISIPITRRSSFCGRDLEFPAPRFTPLEGFPSSAAALCHHSRCLPDVPLTPNPAETASEESSHQSTPVPQGPEGSKVPAFLTTEVAHHTGQSVLFLKLQPKLFLQFSFSPLPKKRHNRSASRPWLGAYRPSIPKNQPSIRVRPASEESCRTWSTLAPAEAEVPEDRGASTSEEIDLPLTAVHPPERGLPTVPNQSSAKPGTDTEDAPTHRNASTHQRVSPRCSEDRNPLLS